MRCHDPSRVSDSGEQLLDRKFPFRWVLFSEGDGWGMLMTGYIHSLFTDTSFVVQV